MPTSWNLHDIMVTIKAAISFIFVAMSTVLSMAYLPNVAWMRQLLANPCIIDIHEHFTKQTYRNRAVILAANGPLQLTIPIQKTGPKMTMKDLIPDHSINWQRQHWESIKTAYGSSPFFIHYAPHFEKLYSQPVAHVLSFEIDLLHLILKLFKVNPDFTLSEKFIERDEHVTDLRDVISPKVISNEVFKTYLQVFAEKFPFQANLSCIDILFNHGSPGLRYIV